MYGTWNQTRPTTLIRGNETGVRIFVCVPFRFEVQTIVAVNDVHDAVCRAVGIRIGPTVEDDYVARLDVARFDVLRDDDVPRVYRRVHTPGQHDVAPARTDELREHDDYQEEDARNEEC